MLFKHQTFFILFSLKCHVVLFNMNIMPSIGITIMHCKFGVRLHLANTNSLLTSKHRKKYGHPHLTSVIDSDDKI